MITRLDLASKAYEQLLALLRHMTLTSSEKDLVTCELRCRDRAMYNQWVQVCGGQYK